MKAYPMRLLLQQGKHSSRAALLVPPYTHPVRHLAVDDTRLVCPLWLPVRYLHKRFITLRPVGFQDLALFIVPDVFSGLLQKLLVDSRW